MTHSLPFPSDFRPPYLIAEAPRAHFALEAESVFGGRYRISNTLDRAVIAGAVIAPAGLIAGRLFAALRSRSTETAGRSPALRPARGGPREPRSAGKATKAKRANEATAPVTAGVATKASNATEARATVGSTGSTGGGNDPAELSLRDVSRIAMNEDYEVRYWASKFGVDRAALRPALHLVGDGAEAVERELGKS